MERAGSVLALSWRVADPALWENSAFGCGLTGGTVPRAKLFLLHGRGMTGDRMANYTAAAELTRDFGTWVVLPQAIGSEWASDPVGSNSSTDAPKAYGQDARATMLVAQRPWTAAACCRFPSRSLLRTAHDSATC